MQVAAHAVAAGKVERADSGYRFRLALVAIHVGDVVVHHDVVVHVVHVARAHPVGRPKSFVWRQREPAQARLGRRSLAERDVPVHATAVTPHKGDQRRCVHRARRQAARHPAPARANLSPAAVVKRCKAPGCVVNPGPAPGRNPAPVADPVRGPVNGHGSRQPHGAVGRILAPVAVAIELLVTDGFAGNIASRDRLVFAAIPLQRPEIKAVCRGRTRARRSELRAAEAGLLLLAKIDLRSAVAVDNPGA